MKKSKHTEAPVSKSTLEGSPAHLLHRVLQIALDIYNETAGEGALTQRQYAVLTALDGSEGLSQTDLVKITGIDRSTLADLVARMITKELLVRERSATDARANLVQLAPAGKTALDDMQPRVLLADEKILSLLSPPKRDSFVKLLRKITSAREAELSGEAPVSKDKPEKKLEKKKKKHKLSAKKLKKLPMPLLSDGASEAVAGEDLVHAPVTEQV
ncbi:MarR family winged helix-turn-helix transcriptional regulator [Asticcacaulis sp. AC402]|uniref:MarR family winged helix-turn-helix transcriptional regulator n=1 Tax=Asticcacaulis sp. AC402 TaxID=1282361 RepID=UPI0003C3F2B3|nr:MarR family winged helix-turn-helix transcriptional regulator [Asticcacaulis sp. AC402]ESQ74811.1 MarR family transcriptional regulator [Asticcacaulis sp. AC402]